MSSENQEDLSVEDILSSIRNILVDENGNAIAETQTKTEEPAISLPEIPQTVETKTNDDVFDLDASMIVPSDNGQDIETLLDAPVQEPQSIADSIDIEETINMATQTDFQIPDITIPEPVPVKQEMPAASQPQQTVPAQSSNVQETTIDASADIINNFAKLFAEKQQPTPAKQETPKTQPVAASAAEKENGMTALIQQTIVKQVQQSIDANLQKWAQDAITAQTQTWLDNNLPTIVEKIVAREIERVIAKVGS